MEFVFIQLLLGTVCVFLFQFRNRHKAFLHSVSVFILLIFLSTGLIPTVDWNLFVWFVPMIGLIASYTVRFIKKDSRVFLDYLKLAAIFMLALFPLPSLYPLSNYFQMPVVLISLWMIQYLTLPILAAIYVYDRVTINLTFMKKKFGLIFVCYTIVSLLLLVYAIVQRGLTEEVKMVAEENQKAAEQHAALLQGTIEENALELSRKDLEIDSLKKEIERLRKR